MIPATDKVSPDSACGWNGAQAKAKEQAKADVKVKL
jgi:hypothetical protein